MFIDEFNSRFGTNLPNEGIMELETCPSGNELLEELEKSVPLCAHCVKNEIEWGMCKGNAKLSDFAV